ncbi:unnamed protein product, partial [Musa hybrid cultivar]
MSLVRSMPPRSRGFRLCRILEARSVGSEPREIDIHQGEIMSFSKAKSWISLPCSGHHNSDGVGPVASRPTLGIVLPRVRLLGIFKMPNPRSCGLA